MLSLFKFFNKPFSPPFVDVDCVIFDNSPSSPSSSSPFSSSPSSSFSSLPTSLPPPPPPPLLLLSPSF
jgi:hypothetical protein